jgi:hypothetical protein
VRKNGAEKLLVKENFVFLRLNSVRMREKRGEKRPLRRKIAQLTFIFAAKQKQTTRYDNRRDKEQD